MLCGDDGDGDAVTVRLRCAQEVLEPGGCECEEFGKWDDGDSLTVRHCH